MKRVIKSIGLVVTVFLVSAGICTNSFGATYYIDFSDGVDSNNGTSMLSPFKHSPGDGNATGLAASTTLSAGDVVIFKGGVEYHGKITVMHSGSEGSPITYDGNSAGTWGAGRAIINMDYTITGAFSIKSNNYIDINNFEMKFAAYGSSNVHIKTSTNVNVKNSYIHRNADWDMSSGSNKLGSYFQSMGWGVAIDDSSFVVVDNCEITRMGTGGISIKSVTADIEIKNCRIHDYMVWFMDLSLYGPTETMSRIYIHDNKFYNMFHYSQSYWTGAITDEKVNYSNQPNPHEDTIFIRAPLGGVHEDVRIYNNDFYNEITPTEVGGTALIFTSQLRPGTSIYIFNNTFQNPYPNDVIALGWNQNDGYKIKIYHNTFSLSKGNAIQISEYMASTTHEWHIKNNLFYISNGSTAAALQPLLSGGTCSALWNGLQNNGNLFDVGAGRISNAMGGGCGTTTALISQWRTSSGEESAGIQGTARLINPLTGASSGVSNLRLTSGSAAIDAGIALNLADYPGADRDKDGNIRPRSLGWDIGAYESNFTGTGRRPDFPKINSIP